MTELRGGSAAIAGETAQHLRRVLRVERGQRFEISDGEGMYVAEISGFGKDRVEFQVLEPVEPPTPPVQIHLLPALIKFDHFEWMMEKATELGVARITPVVSARSEKGLAQAAAKRMERWRRIVFESGQQSRRLRPPELDAPETLAAALGAKAGVRLWLDEQRGTRPMLLALPSDRRPGDVVAMLCGPEGGWEDGERGNAVEQGWSAVSLGPQILRAETAALAALSVLGAAWLAAGTSPK